MTLYGTLSIHLICCSCCGSEFVHVTSVPTSARSAGIVGNRRRGNDLLVIYCVVDGSLSIKSYGSDCNDD